MDFLGPDAAEPASLNRVLRLDTKGNMPMPLVDLFLRK